MIIKFIIGALLGVAVTAQAWVPFVECTAQGNYFTRCVLYVDKIQ